MDFLVNKISNHNELKPKILKYIEEYNSPYDTSGDGISKTDWNSTTQRFMNRVIEKYIEYINPFIDNELTKSYKENFGGSRIELINYWFQQYNKDDKHRWHNHPSCHFSNIYYVELPNGAPKTQFYDPKTKQFIQVEVEEGDVLTFPAYYLHSSPLVLDNVRKTVVVFNTNITVDMNKFLEELSTNAGNESKRS